MDDLPPHALPSDVDADFAVLLDHALREAERLLSRFGEFYPFGKAIELEGTPETVVASPEDGGDYPTPESVRETLIAALGEHRASYRAAAITANVTAADGSDAVRVELEHESGVARAALFTYRRRLLTRRFRYLEQHTAPATPQIWP